MTRARIMGIGIVVEQRVQVGPTRFRIPDITIIERDSVEQIIRKAPLFCIEILSPKDRLQRIAARSQDYISMGVPEADRGS